MDKWLKRYGMMLNKDLRQERLRLEQAIKKSDDSAYIDYNVDKRDAVDVVITGREAERKKTHASIVGKFGEIMKHYTDSRQPTDEEVGVAYLIMEVEELLEEVEELRMEVVILRK